MTMETRITSLIVLPEGEPIFSERATIVRIEDEAGGEIQERAPRCAQDRRPVKVPVCERSWS
mgnify:CR=1 FL=1